MADQAANGSKLATVLVVDDDDDARLWLVRAVLPIGVNVVEATDGQEALEKIRTVVPDVVVSDLVMPKMSGLMLLHRLLEEGLAPPFILVTGFSDKESAIQALRLGAFDYLEKPFDEVELREVVAGAIANAGNLARLQAAAADAADGGEAECLEQARFQLQKLRIQGRPPTGMVLEPQSMDQASKHGSAMLRAIFGREAEAHLSLALASVNNAAAAKYPGIELAYAMRVLQGVRTTAEALRLGDVADFAWSVETALSGCRLKQRQSLDQNTSAIAKGIEALQGIIARLVDERLIAVKARLDAIGDSPDRDQNSRSAGTYGWRGKRPA